MSIRIMTLVWDSYPGGGSDLLAMLALADWSDDEGRCYPSMTAIAAKTRLSRSQAQRVVHSLIDGGFVEVMGNEFGGSPGTTRQYRIVRPALTGRMDATGGADATGRTDTQDGSHGCAETGRVDATQTVIEPSVTVIGAPTVPATPAKHSRKPRNKGSKTRILVELCELVAEGVEEGQARDWLTLRNAKKLPLTPSAWATVKSEAQEVGLDANRAVAYAVGSNWGGFKAAWYRRENPEATAPRVDRFAGAR